MSYLIQTARPHSISVGGINVTSELIEFTCSDASVFKNGIMTTNGSIVLGAKYDTSGKEDYDRNSFKRGDTVIVDITYPDGSVQRHPRGFLYVAGVQYEPESEQLLIDLTCKLGMAKLLDDPSEILTLVPIPLDPAQRTMEGASASFQSAGSFVWQDNLGVLQVSKMFPEGINPVPSADVKFASVRGQTAISVAPLQGSGAIPDQIEISYKVPADSVVSDDQGRVDTVSTTSYYYVRYPGVTYYRSNGIVAIGGDTSYKNECWKLGSVTFPGVPTPSSTNACGSAPPNPSRTYNIPQRHQCLDCYSSVESVEYVNAVRTETQTTVYNGPAGQVSSTTTSVFGPAIEANNQYYADMYNYCQRSYASGCDPNGSCPMYGLETISLGYSTTGYVYGDANELVRTVVDTYRPLISLMKPSDWRSGVVGGVPQDFNGDIIPANLFRYSRVITETYQEGNVNVQEVNTWTSATSRGSGTRNLDASSIDALRGIHTKQIRRSSTITTIDVAPDRVNAPETATATKKTSVALVVGGGYIDEYGPYIEKDDIPAALLFDDKDLVDSALRGYSDYISRFYQGDARGLNITEGLRKAIGNDWEPNQPFWYYDDIQDELMSCRGDAHTWGITDEGSIVAMSAIWLDDHEGVVTVGGNLTGNATPVIPADPSVPVPSPNPPVPGGGDPSVDDGGPINRSYLFYVDIEFRFNTSSTPLGSDGIVPPPPEPETVNVQLHFIPVVFGLIVEAGGAVSPDADGSMPVDWDGLLVVDDSLVINEDLFS